MKLTNQQVFDLYEGLQSVRARCSEALPIKVSFAIIHDIKQLEPSVAAIYEARDNFISNLADDISGNVVHIPDDKRDIMNDALKQLSEIEIECDLLPLSLSSLSGLSFSLDETSKLYPIIRMD